MFASLGRLVYRRRRVVAGLWILLVLVLGLPAASVSEHLSSGGWVVPGAESSAVQARIAELFGTGKGQLVVVMDGGPGADARSPEFRTAATATIAGLAADPRVERTFGWDDLPDDRFISVDGTMSFTVVEMRLPDEQLVDLVPELEALLVPADGIEAVHLSGYPPIAYDSARISEEDLKRAETLSLPIALLILIAVFTSLIAAGTPLVVAGVAIPVALGLIGVLAERTEMSIYVLNVSTMLGLALAIDYSLFVVSRYREELAAGRTVGAAVERSVATSGKAVVFSALAVAVGLAGLMVFESSALTSIGVAGAITVAASAAAAVTFLPAVLGMLGPRVNALSVRSLVDRIRPARPAAPGPTRWERVATRVMAHPIAVIVPVVAFLLLLGMPFIHLRQAVPDAATLPASAPSRVATMLIDTRFPPGETSPIQILATVDGDPTSEAGIRTLAGYAAALEALDGIDRVESPFSNVRNPVTGALLTTDELVAAYRTPSIRPLLQPLLDTYVRGSVVRLDAISPYPAARPAATDLIPVVRAVETGDALSVQVGGLAAGGHDFIASMTDRLPIMLLLVIAAMAVILFLLLGSIVLPIKAIAMTLLSLTASFGALVWIFQDGNLSGLLGFEAPGYTVAGNPIIMFAVIFGLSMDYEVLLLSRIQEAYRRTGDNTAAVGEGLARTAGVITGAALIMVVVFGAFALADTLTIKSIGVGMAIAVALDATVIRVLLVPATMRLLGRWNWWAPGPLGRLADRLGFSHAEDEAGA